MIGMAYNFQSVFKIGGKRRDLERLIGVRQDPDVLVPLRKIDELAKLAEARPHLYLKFYGD